MFCGNCGSELERDDVFCPVCGEKVEFCEEGETLEVMNSGSAAASNCCEVCGTPYEEGDVFCLVCGSKLHQQRSNPSPAVHYSPKACENNGAIDLTERHELVILSRKELSSGCQKTVEIDGRQLLINIPPHYRIKDSMYFPGYGYTDSATGITGTLKVDFIVQ